MGVRRLSPVCVLLAGTLCAGAGSPNSRMVGRWLVPKPKIGLPASGKCDLPRPLQFNLVPGLSEETVRLTLGDSLALASVPSAGPPRPGIRLVLGDPGAGDNSPEAYRLRIETDSVEIVGRTAEGVLNGLRTLAQLALTADLYPCEIKDWPDMSLRGGHLCYHLVRESLAYNTPNFDALLEQIDRLASLKMSAVLLELESMFPYRKHSKVTCDIAFTPEQVQQLRHRLSAHHMEIIPLVQCLGHAYNVLSHDEYAAYREMPDRTQQYCPTNDGVADLYMEFVEEYLAQIPEIRQWHMGGDESRMLGWCARCKAKMEKEGVSRLYVDHVGEVARRVKAKGLEPMLWSDMLEHHPEAMGLLPDGLKLVYWNYDLPAWSRPYAGRLFMERGFDVIGAGGVRFGSSGTELSVYYPECLRGLESLIPRMARDGCREMLITNWMKGSPHESTDYGFAYGAALCWNGRLSRAEFQQRYARLTFGVEDGSICTLYETLSLPLPYAEPVQRHMPDGLDRLNLSGFRFQEKWKQYTSPDQEPIARQQLLEALAAAEGSLERLRQLRPERIRGNRFFEILKLSATCIQAKARMGLALHKGRLLQNDASRTSERRQWAQQDVPEVLMAWDRAKALHRAMLLETGFAPCVEFLNELMFEPAEREFLQRMAGSTSNPDVGP